MFIEVSSEAYGDDKNCIVLTARADTTNDSKSHKMTVCVGITVDGVKMPLVRSSYEYLRWSRVPSWSWFDPLDKIRLKLVGNERACDLFDNSADFFASNTANLIDDAALGLELLLCK